VKYEAHSYQVYATEFIKANPIAAILLDMGMGKRIIPLTALADLLSANEAHRILVVAHYGWQGTRGRRRLQNGITSPTCVIPWR
jgi:hypothetical protein